MKKILYIITTVILVTALASGSIVSSSAASLTDGLIAFYNFEDAQYPGKDVSGSGNHLYYYQQGATYAPSNEKMALDAIGHNGKAAYFNGTNGLMAIPDSEGKDFIDKVTSLTVMLDIKLDVNKCPVGPHIRILDNGVNIVDQKGKGGFGFYTYFAGKTAAKFTVWPALRDKKGMIYSPAEKLQHVIDYDYDQWHKVWITIDNTSSPATVNLYIDGNWTQQTLENSNGFKFSETMFNFNIGGSCINENGILRLLNDTSTGAYVGSVDELYIFNKALTEEELNRVENEITAKSVANPPALTNPSGNSSTVSSSSVNSSEESSSEEISSSSDITESSDISSFQSSISNNSGNVKDEGGNTILWVVIIILILIIAGLVVFYMLSKKKKN